MRITRRQLKKLVQEALKDRGLYTQKIDGKWGKGTREAANKYLNEEFPGKNYFSPRELRELLNDGLRKYLISQKRSSNIGERLEKI